MLTDTRPDLGQLHRDIVRTAELVEVTPDRRAVERTLDVFQELFSVAAVAFRTTTHDPAVRDLDVRYLDLTTPHDPFQMAVEAGLLKLTGHPVEAVFPEIKALVSKVGFGSDISVRYGFRKIWPFFLEPVPVQAILGLPSMPASAKNSAATFARFGFTGVNTMAIDYRAKTVNVYFLTKPGALSPEKVAAMIADAGFKVPSRTELEIGAQPFILYYTFSWDSPRIERLCFAMAAQAEKVPTHLHPIIKRMVDQAPIRGDHRQFTYNTTYGLSGDYYKIEADYFASIDQVLGALFSGLSS